MKANVLLQPVIIASISLLASVVTASLSYMFTKRHQLKMEERRLKEEFYRSFIKALSDCAINNNDDASQKRLSEGFNSLILIANSKVVEKLMKFHDFIKPSSTNSQHDIQEWLLRHDTLLTELIKAMRQDLFGKCKNDNHFPVVHLVGKKVEKIL